MNRLYPYKLEAKIVPAIWGGDALVTRYGKAGDRHAKLGESWECWGENAILNGDCAGETLNGMFKNTGPALIGLTPPVSKGRFPILTKFIDAHESLSVQVHPTDEYARSHEDQPNGKTECWVILEAAPGAELVLGFSKATSEAEVRQRIAQGTLGDLLRRVKVKAGDVFFLPAGTVHAIGAGIVLYEVQQASDLTYRLFDWNRKDAAGKPRELHVDKAAAVLSYEASKNSALQSLEYRLEGIDRRLLVVDSRFGVEELQVQKIARFFTESVCSIVTAKSVPLQVRTSDKVVEMEPWSTVVIPAGVPRVEIEGAEDTSCFLVTPAAANERVRSRLGLINYDTAAIDKFLSQFAGLPTAV